jgi:hypothetical protein
MSDLIAVWVLPFLVGTDGPARAVSVAGTGAGVEDARANALTVLAAWQPAKDGNVHDNNLRDLRQHVADDMPDIRVAQNEARQVGLAFSVDETPAF